MHPEGGPDPKLFFVPGLILALLYYGYPTLVAAVALMGGN